MYDIELDKKHIRKNISLEGKEGATSTVLLTNFRASLLHFELCVLHHHFYRFLQILMVADLAVNIPVGGGDTPFLSLSGEKFQISAPRPSICKQ